MIDIFGQRVHVGDTVAVGMAYNRSSVLRVGEVMAIRETHKGVAYDGSDYYKWSVRIKWTHNGSGQKNSYFEVKDSTILHESTHTFAKLIVLPPGCAQQFPSDVTDR